MTHDTSTTPLGVDSARTTIASVFRQAEYHRSLRRTLWQQLVEWIGDLYHAVLAAMRSSPTLRWSVVAVIVLVVLLLISRSRFLQQARMGAAGPRAAGGRATGTSDHWSIAQSEARDGRYIDAAHALYLAILESLARTDRVVVDSAKTVGDYSRDLRRTASRSLPLYRKFARAYEPVVWGSRDCNRECFEQLSEIATQLTGRRA